MTFLDRTAVAANSRRRRRFDRRVGFVLVLAALLFGSVGLEAPSTAGAAATGVGGSIEASVVAGGARSAVGWYSSNWAGYVTRSTTFTRVSGEWTVPSVSTSQSGYSAVWLGIGGVSEHELIQVGTMQNVVAGRARYRAWWEILPAPAVEIRAFSVHPGDHITATVWKVSGTTWRISISNRGHGSFTITRTWGGDGSSAEWIVEAPTVNWRQSRLARFSLVTFDHVKANGSSPRLTSSQSGALIQSGVRVATPSAPDAERDGFAVRRSSSAPPAPGT
jgi:hypothetical protein